ncbi:MAG: DUF1189 domain-containing protein [Bacillota bacterium]
MQQLLRQFIQSIRNPRGYGELVDQPRKRVISYFLALSLASVLIMLVPGLVAIERVSAQAIQLIHELPPFSVENGQLQFSGQMPYVISDRKGNPVFVIDTKADLASASGSVRQVRTGVVVLGDRVVIKNRGELMRQQYPLSQFSTPWGFSNDDLGQYIEQWQDRWHRNTVIFIIAALTITSVLRNIVYVLVTALLGKAVCRMRGLDLPYRRLVKLAVYATTLPIVLFTANSLFDLNIPRLNWILYGIAVVYLWLAVDSLKLPDEDSLAISED